MLVPLSTSIFLSRQLVIPSFEGSTKDYAFILGGNLKPKSIFASTDSYRYGFVKPKPVHKTCILNPIAANT